MFNNLVEDWFREALHLPFAELISVHGWGLPIVHLHMDFLAPSFLGDVLSASLSVAKLGKSSMTLDIVLQSADRQDRVRGQLILVLIDMHTKQTIPIPDHLRASLGA